MLVASPQFLGCMAIKGSRVMIAGWIALLVYEFGGFLALAPGIDP